MTTTPLVFLHVRNMQKDGNFEPAGILLSDIQGVRYISEHESKLIVFNHIDNTEHTLIINDNVRNNVNLINSIAQGKYTV